MRWRSGFPIGRPVATSQIIAERSSEDVTTFVPSGLNATSTTQFLWRSTARRAPVVASHNRASKSSLADAINLPSGLNATFQIILVCQRFGVSGLPEGTAQIRTAPLPAPVTTLVLSGEKAACRTEAW